MSSATYQRLPTSPDFSEANYNYPPSSAQPNTDHHLTSNPNDNQHNIRAIFDPPPPPVWQRVALLFAILGMFWFALRVGTSKQQVEGGGDRSVW
ncbi:hypothetical protein QFC24_006549 [Naganishia onofrii]|uniref:Uncharacterized protein n=1 Tax=Naganishia onofrii TaxID=1851511 RepID=A0ACC2X109_9TREE|nr:hypothetical protein QFC24_006549 [Naganishia onofrii]